jgi:hypothetical protein
MTPIGRNRIAYRKPAAASSAGAGLRWQVHAAAPLLSEAVSESLIPTGRFEHEAGIA